VNTLQANHEQGYKKALEKGQLEPDLLRSSSSAIRSAEDKLGDIDTSNLIFVFSKFNFSVCLRESRRKNYSRDTEAPAPDPIRFVQP